MSAHGYPGPHSVRFSKMKKDPPSPSERIRNSMFSFDIWLKVQGTLIFITLKYQ